jgi:protein-disulfide isomerase
LDGQEGRQQEINTIDVTSSSTVLCHISALGEIERLSMGNIIMYFSERKKLHSFNNILCGFCHRQVKFIISTEMADKEELQIEYILHIFHRIYTPLFEISTFSQCNILCV